MVSVAYTPPNPWSQIGQGLGSIGQGYMQQQNLQQEMSQNQRRLDIMERDAEAQEAETTRKKAYDWIANVNKIMETTDPGAQRNFMLYQLNWATNLPVQGTLPDGTNYDYVNEPRRLTQAQKIAESEEMRDKETHRIKLRTEYTSEVDDFVKSTKATYDQYLGSLVKTPRYKEVKGPYGIEKQDRWIDEKQDKTKALVEYDNETWIVTKEEKEYAKKMSDYSQMMTFIATALKDPDLEKSQLYYDIVNYIQPGDVDWKPGMGRTPLLNKIKQIIKDKKSGKMKIGKPLTLPTTIKPPGGANVTGQIMQDAFAPSLLPPGLMSGQQPPTPMAPPQTPQSMQQGPMPPGMRAGPPGGQQAPPQQQVPPWFGQLSPDDQLAVLEAASKGQSMQEIEMKLRAGGLIR